MFRIYSGIDQSAHLQSSSSGFEVNCQRKTCVYVSRNTFSCSFTSAWFVV